VGKKKALGQKAAPWGVPREVGKCGDREVRKEAINRGELKKAGPVSEIKRREKPGKIHPALREYIFPDFSKGGKKIEALIHGSLKKVGKKDEGNTERKNTRTPGGGKKSPPDYNPYGG